MHTPRTVLITVAAVALASCGGDDATSRDDAVTTPSTPSSTTSTTDDASATSPSVTTTATAPSPGTTEPVDSTVSAGNGEAWRDILAQRCQRLGSTLASTPWPASTAAFPTFAEHWHEFGRTAPLPNPLPDVRGEVGDLSATMAAVARELDDAVAAAARDDADAAYLALDRADDLLIQSAGMTVVAGVECLGLDPARAADAALNVPVLGAWQIENALGSIWVSREFMHEVVRIDPATGDVVATIPVGSRPIKLHGADGRLWVRTAEAFEAIDPTTNTVSATLRKSDVGPAANRSWALDGAMWICDGTMLHRYDPTTVERSASVELERECGQVHATVDLVTAWTYNEDDGESGDSAAVFVDPATNAVVATVELPVDVGVPVVLDDRVVFPGHGGSAAVIVDRGTWGIAATADLGRRTGGSQTAFDGSFLYVPTHDKLDVLVVDPVSYEVVDTIHPLEVNSVAPADGGGVWTASNTINFVQRFDRPG